MKNLLVNSLSPLPSPGRFNGRDVVLSVWSALVKSGAITVLASYLQAQAASNPEPKTFFFCSFGVLVLATMMRLQTPAPQEPPPPPPA